VYAQIARAELILTAEKRDIHVRIMNVNLPEAVFLISIAPVIKYAIQKIYVQGVILATKIVIAQNKEKFVTNQPINAYPRVSNVQMIVSAPTENIATEVNASITGVTPTAIARTTMCVNNSPAWAGGCVLLMGTAPTGSIV
jgi:hypothetical protein